MKDRVELVPAAPERAGDSWYSPTAGQGRATGRDLTDERIHLGAALEAIERAVAAPLKANTGAGDEAAVLAMEAYRAWRRVELRQALGSPYFGRIDFVPEDTGRPETYYIGKTFFEGGGIKITGWQAPVAALFYRSTCRQAAYDAPQGPIQGRLTRRRRLAIERGELLSIADDLSSDDPAARHQIDDALSSDGLLRATLSGGASPYLRDIIATIQPDQYTLIAAPADQVLVVQGVAGSGKTSIGLHRLSYLIYPALVAGKIPPRCIVFGPNRLFMKYIAAVLPKLGLQFAEQTTLAGWALGRMGLKQARLVDTTFEALLSPDISPAQQDRELRRSRLKTSARFGRLLERYVAWRRNRIHLPEEGWTIHQTIGERRLEQHIPAHALRSRHSHYADRPFAVHRALFLESLLALIHRMCEPQGVAGAQAQLALGRKRFEQAADLEAQARRQTPGAGGGGASGETARTPFGEAPEIGASSPRWGGPGSRPPGPSGVGAPAAALSQTLRQLELAAQRRRQEGEALIREAEATLASVLSPAEAEAARKGARAVTTRLLDRHWPAIDPLADYAAMLRDGELLRRLAEGQFTDEEIALLTEPAANLAGPKGKKGRAPTIDHADLPALHYLFVLSQDPEIVGRTVHEHVVIDEAQDVSELDLYCLRRLEVRQRFTLLGDLAQSIFGHRGLISWEQAAAVFSGAPFRYEQCTVSYRTTAEITALANRARRSIARLAATDGASPAGALLDHAASGAPAAEAFDRHGPEPVLTRCRDDDELAGQIAASLHTLRVADQGNIAIITKTATRARRVAELLASLGVDRVALATTPDFDYRGGTVLLPVHLAKGLEFDTAIVVDADDATYRATAFDARLLYVALSRALHALHVLWTGQLSQHLVATPADGYITA